VIRAGNFGLGMLVIFLDMLKGAAPVAVAHYVYGVDGWPLAPVIVAPMLGHAFSPFLRFRGGKAVATTFGAWTSLTVPFGPFVMTLPLLAAHLIQSVSGWAVMTGLLALLIFLLATGAGLPVLAAWAGTAALLIWKHRAELAQKPALKPRIRKLLRR
jgi:glycerol-3-phosphate acyltransferase PlsY